MIMRLVAVAMLACGLTTAASASEPVESTGHPGLTDGEIPNILIVRIAVIGDQADLTSQSENEDADVFALKVPLVTLRDGTVDVKQLRSDVIEMMREQEPIRIEINTAMEGLPSDLMKQFFQAEKQTADSAGKPVVAWRGYGPVRGYNAGVVAYGRAPYRAYYPGAAYPYYGYYQQPIARDGREAEGTVYHFHYGIQRSTPSYHYFGYYRLH